MFNSEDEAIARHLCGQDRPGDVVVIRYEGPKGGPGMREMLNPTSALAGMKLTRQWPHHRRPLLGASRGAAIGHVSPRLLPAAPSA